MRKKLGYALVGTGVIFTVGCVVGAEVLVDGVFLCLRGAGGNGAMDEQLDAIAHKAAHVINRVGGHVVGSKSGVGGEVKVLERVE